MSQLVHRRRARGASHCSRPSRPSPCWRSPRRRPGEGGRAHGTTTVTPTAQTTQFLASHGVSVSATGRATLANGAFSLPVVAGIARTQDFTGVLVHAGGLRFAKGSRSLVVQKLVAVRTQRNAVVLAQVPGLHGGCAKVASALRRFAATHPRFVRRHPGVARRVVPAPPARSAPTAA